MPGRRGTPTLRASDGRWQTTVQVDKKRWYVYGATRRECTDKANALRLRLATGTQELASTMRLGAYLQHWTNDIIEGTVRPSTLTQYRNMARHVTTHIGQVKLCDLRAGHVQRCIGLMQQDLGPNTVRQYLNVLRHALQTALEWDMLSTPRNPAKLATPPAEARTPMVTLSLQQTHQLIDGTRGTRYGALWHMLVLGGLRRGEALALEWSDLDRDLLTVSRTLLEPPGTPPIPGPTKTRSSNRVVLLPSTLVSALEEHQELYALPRAIAQPHLMFPSNSGSYIRPSNLPRRLALDLEELGLPHLTPHGLRHTAATLRMQRADIHPKTVQEMLGHSSIKMTLDTYSHVGEELHRAAAAAIDDLMRSS